jgi:hypothetical protein
MLVRRRRPTRHAHASPTRVIAQMPTTQSQQNDVGKAQLLQEADDLSSSALAKGDFVEQLANFAKLHADGIITDDEFKNLKRNLIGSSKSTDANQTAYFKQLKELRDRDGRRNRGKGIAKAIVPLLLIIGLGIVVVVILGRTPIKVTEPDYIEIARYYDPMVGLQGVTITNISTEPIVISEVQFNNRVQCNASFLLQVLKDIMDGKAGNNVDLKLAKLAGEAFATNLFGGALTPEYMKVTIPKFPISLDMGQQVNVLPACEIWER